MIVTNSAKAKINSLISCPSDRLRIEILSGGCSGFTKNYSLSKKSDDDIEIDNIIVVDSISWDIIKDSIFDWKQSISEEKFELTLPNINSSCGCGKSFNI